MPYATINDGEATPLQIPDDGYSTECTTAAAPSSTKKPTSSTIVRALMVATAVAVGTLLLLAGPSKMTRNSASHVDGMVVVSSRPGICRITSDGGPCYVAEGTFSGLSCKNKHGYCAGPGGSFGGGHAARTDFETCYVSNNPPPNNRCWSRSHCVITCSTYYVGSFVRCDPVGYFDGDSGYKRDGIWHVSTPFPDGSCGNPCREFSHYIWDDDDSGDGGNC